MKSNLSILIIFLSFFRGYITGNLPAHWIDPDDMSLSPDYLKYVEGPVAFQEYYEEPEVPNCRYNNNGERVTEAYFRRAINMLLNAVHRSDDDDDEQGVLFRGHLFFELAPDEYEVLRGFARGDRALNLQQIDAILTGILRKPSQQFLQEFLETWIHKALNLALSREGIVLMLVLSYVYVVYKMFHMRFYSWYVLKFLLINFLMFDFAFTAVSMYKEAQVKRMSDMRKYKEMPVECDPERMSSLRFFVNMFKHEDVCEKYHMIIYQDLFWTISPFSVVGEMFSRLIQTPAKALGTAFGDISSQLFNAFPWPYNIIFLPLLLFFFCIMTCILLSFALNKSFGFDFFRLIKFHLGEKNPQSTTTTTGLSGDLFEKLIDKIPSTTTTNRQYIEDIPVASAASRPQMMLRGELDLSTKEIQDYINVKLTEQLAAMGMTETETRRAPPVEESQPHHIPELDTLISSEISQQRAVIEAKGVEKSKTAEEDDVSVIGDTLLQQVTELFQSNKAGWEEETAEIRSKEELGGGDCT